MKTDCPNCGTTNVTEWPTCWKCGHDLHPEAAASGEESSTPCAGYACAPGAIALLEMRYWLAMIEHENLAAGREEALGGWLCDHSGAVSHYAAQFDEAKSRAQAHSHTAAISDDAP